MVEFDKHYVHAGEATQEARRFLSTLRVGKEKDLIDNFLMDYKHAG